MKKIKYISTTLPYANSVPHIGHDLEFTQADALAKFLRKIGHNVFFNIGVDEHGLKVYEKAAELGINTQDYLDDLAVKWKEFCSLFQIEADNFYRTTDPEHIRKNTVFWNECMERGDLYKKKYTGFYCKGCESFKTKTDLVDGKCPDHNAEPTVTEEENWFFRVTKYKDALIDWFDKNPDVLQPKSKREELRNIILAAEDISVSRLKTNVPWGIEVPGDPNQVMYCWWEALTNYFFAIDDFSSVEFIQLYGNDNQRFQGSLFQAILESASLPHTHRLLTHGTILDEQGRKMSKTLGNVIDPIDQLNKFGLDAVRYYTLAGLTTYGDGCWSEADLIKLYNSELADDFGNLVARTLHLIDKNSIDIKPLGLTSEGDFALQVNLSMAKAMLYWENYDIDKALRETNALVKLGNKYINDKAPWSMKEGYQDVLNDLYYLLRVVTELYSPVLSKETITKLETAINDRKKAIIFKKILV